ncbi:HEPN domain-containing protein [Aeromonas salmonicida]|uniref:HEPN domain-containing protein n=1 Tax=Aeromonas salmonicida TaxID=645 RepID=UPI0024A8CCEC|nr:HEPN domain-containing protein [Aeromonas salmonicida]MDM5135022.1 HEPN domain-containing protein [Aeromonas salmonicida]WHF41136.1 HEPN domain-containing protein [Aeromonas salmonicida]
MNFEQLKKLHREIRDHSPANLRLRVHRALSWLQRAEMAEDEDGRFIFLWIAFNAAYATEIDEHRRLSEQETFKSFLEKLCELDEHRQIEQLVWQEFSGSIRILLDTPVVLQSFWDFHSGRISETQWKERLAQGKRMASQALASGNTPQLLGVVFNRLYTLRNQLMHGGATWNGSVNRKQLKDCANLLGKLTPVIIALMMAHPQTLWGDACYPVVEITG